MRVSAFFYANRGRRGEEEPEGVVVGVPAGECTRRYVGVRFVSVFVR